MSEEKQSNLMWLRTILNDGLVTNPEMAVKIAEIVLTFTYSEREVEQQRPFVATEQKESWLVEGSYNKEQRMGDLGPAKVVIGRIDGRILDVRIPKLVTYPFPTKPDE